MDVDLVRENTKYPDRIANDVMKTALISQTLVKFCEWYKIHTALLTSFSRYTCSVISGDTITTTLRLAAKLDNKKRIRFDVQTINQHDEVVMIAELLEQCI